METGRNDYAAPAARQSRKQGPTRTGVTETQGPERTGDDSNGMSAAAGEERPPVSRMPLIVGAVAIGLLVWMVVVVFALIAWRLSGG